MTTLSPDPSPASQERGDAAAKDVVKGHEKKAFGRVIEEELRGLMGDGGAGGGGGGRGESAGGGFVSAAGGAGEYAALFAGQLRKAAGRGSGLTEERELAREALWRLMGAPEVDVVKLAHAVSRLVGEAVRAARLEARVKGGGGGEAAGLARLAELVGVLETEKPGRKPRG